MIVRAILVIAPFSGDACHEWMTQEARPQGGRSADFSLPSGMSWGISII